MIFDNSKEVISEWRSAKQRRIDQSSWITWPIRLWLLWGIVLWKDSLCKTWIVFILIKCICFIIKINHVWSRVKKTLLFKKTLFSPKPIVFPKNPLFSNMCTFLSHCFETKNYHCEHHYVHNMTHTYKYSLQKGWTTSFCNISYGPPLNWYIHK